MDQLALLFVLLLLGSVVSVDRVPRHPDVRSLR